MTVALVSRDGTRPSGLADLDSRLVSGPHEVHTSDDVVLFYGSGMAQELTRFSAEAEGDLPPVAVLAHRLDWQDVSQALGHGANSYLLATRYVMPALPWMLKFTAHGGSCLDPAIAAEQAAGRARALERGKERGLRKLSQRERQLMELLTAGQSVRDIAREMFLTEKTVRNYLSRIYGKLEVRGRSEAILRWLGHMGAAATDDAPVRERVRTSGPEAA
ncbi:response regulator transcription factor [Streptomyces sp. AC550_RSS872]|uniref:helix-turn-helix transcriptional regulator n=1 Tax=Streptomyces sp. AC550_RSS872 TaxID=2823689 RepID=UPI001C25EB93|nr:response regulator transcription factor [Streptomyces sp. AC550_RSS872]